MDFFLFKKVFLVIGSTGGAVDDYVSACLTHLGLIPILKWVEFVDRSHIAFSGFSRFPASTKKNTSKFQFDLNVNQGLKYVY